MKCGTEAAVADSDSLIAIERIASQIYLIRGEKVMLDSDLAELYGVPTKALNQAVTRNRERFPRDFMFRLTWEEYRALRSQIVTLSSEGWGRHTRRRNNRSDSEPVTDCDRFPRIDSAGESSYLPRP